MSMLIKVINDHNLFDMRFHVSMRRVFAVFTALLDSSFPIHSPKSLTLSLPISQCVCVFDHFLFVSFPFVSRAILNSCLTHRKIYYSKIVYRYRVIILLCYRFGSCTNQVQALINSSRFYCDAGGAFVYTCVSKCYRFAVAVCHCNHNLQW